MIDNTRPSPPCKKTLLVVDDEKSIVALASELFTAQGYNVLTAYDGEQALSLIKTQPVDLLVCDVVMPNLGGWQLASLVRKSYPNIKIQMISGFPDEAHPGLKNEDLYQNLLHKPFSSNSLIERVQDLITSNKQTDMLANRTILIIDDKKETCKLLEKQLLRLSCITMIAHTKDQAVTIYQQSLANKKPIDVVLLGPSFSVAEGGSALEELREIYPQVKTIIANSQWLASTNIISHQTDDITAAVDKSGEKAADVVTVLP